jgi:hypothetical protein
MSDQNTDIEVAKLELEREKFAHEAKWKRRTYVWTIISAVIATGVTLTVAFYAGSGETTPLNLAVGPVENCLNSLKRTESLSQLPEQSVANLANAVQIHVGNCEGFLETLVDALK